MLDLYKKGESQINIGKILAIDFQKVFRILKGITKKIVKKYNEIYEDWLNLNYIKGKYKKCSKCGEVKLVSGFSKHSLTKDGVRPNCKICDKK